MIRINTAMTLLMVLFLAGCSNGGVYVSLSNTRLDNPEVSSKPLQVNLAWSNGNRKYLMIEKIAEGDYGNEGTGFVRASITTIPGLALSVNDGAGSVLHFAAKYQFYGQYSDQSKTGNISQAITLGYEKKNTKGTSTTGIQSDYGYTYDDDSSWQHNTGIYDVAWIVGYKLSPHNIIYGGPFYQWGTLKGSKNFSSGVSKNLNSNGSSIGANIAIEHRFTYGLGVGAELLYSSSNWAGYHSSDSAFNFKVDFQF
ncbi:hypothetical protein CMT41_18025 [Colwellia sp. MT41]|uniref:hypothetical protein n=1 Tax=Colwellia sp. MT41 TaxID=58049 RepID=UPI000717A770|nr:hypothetical protein [Colwellia sp. MT41]ALO36428.1 hypothetical protein CMT41_18025 [Colwellia sp. MT41]